MVVRDRSPCPHPCIRFLLDRRSAACADCPGQATAVLQVLVGCINDRIYRLSGYIALHKLERTAWG